MTTCTSGGSLFVFEEQPAICVLGALIYVLATEHGETRCNVVILAVGAVDGATSATAVAIEVNEVDTNIHASRLRPPTSTRVVKSDTANTSAARSGYYSLKTRIFSNFHHEARGMPIVGIRPPGPAELAFVVDLRIAGSHQQERTHDVRSIALAKAE